VEEKTLYFAVIGTRRADLGESVAALLSTEALAAEIARRLVAWRPWLLRCCVRQVYLTCEQAAEIVGRWGREDAARGQPVEYADRIMEPYREVYVAGYRAGRSAALTDD